MAVSSKIKIMISSRCDDPFSDDERRTLTDIRNDLKKRIEATNLFGKQLYEVWINEATPPMPASADSWEVCLQAVADCDILLVLFNGHAGWANTAGDIGICHAELMTALSRAPGKVWLIELPPVSRSKPDEKARNDRFGDYKNKLNLFRGGTVKTIADLHERVDEALHDAAVSLMRRGVRDSSKGRFHSGAALDWSRLDFAARQLTMVSELRDALKSQVEAKEKGDGALLQIKGGSVFFRSAAIPAALTVTAAREMVGQPFLRDHLVFPDLGTIDVGPVHVIACQKAVTEAQAIRLLGFPDATVVSAPFGVYVADDVQKIQMFLIANCRDPTTTRHGVQRLFEWLEQTGEDVRLADRAKARKKIIAVMHAESPAASKTMSPP